MAACAWEGRSISYTSPTAHFETAASANEMFLFFFVTFAQTACFLFSVEFHCGEGKKSYFPLVSAALMIFVLVLS